MRYLALFILLAFSGCSRNQHLVSRTLAPAELTKLQIRTHSLYSTPEWIQGPLVDLAKVKTKNRVDSVLQFIAANPDLFKLQDPVKELELLSSHTDELGFQHLRFSRQYNKIPIWNDDLIVHINKQNQLYLINGRYHGSKILVSDFTIPAEQAAEIGLARAQEKGLTQIKENKPVWYPVDSRLRPAHHLVVSSGDLSWDYFVAADTGEILFSQDRRRF